MKLKNIFSNKKVKAVLLASGISTIAAGTGITIGINLKQACDQKEYVSKMQNYLRHQFMLSQHKSKTFNPELLYQSPDVKRTARSDSGLLQSSFPPTTIKSTNGKGYTGNVLNQTQFDALSLVSPKIYKANTNQEIIKINFELENDIMSWWYNFPNAPIKNLISNTAPASLTLADVLQDPQVKKWESDFDDKFSAKSNRFINWEAFGDRYYLKIDFTFEDFIKPYLKIKDFNSSTNGPLKIDHNTKKISLVFSGLSVKSDWEQKTKFTRKNRLSIFPFFPNIDLKNIRDTSEIQLSWDYTINEKTAKKLFKKANGKLSTTQSGQAPAKLSSSDILALFDSTNGASKRTNTNLSTSDLTFGPGDKTKTATITLTSTDGSTQTRQFEINYVQSKNEVDAKKWFDSIPSSSSYQPTENDANKALTTQEVLGWLGVSRRFSGMTSPTFLGTAPRISETSRSITFKLQFPTDGQSGTSTMLPTKSFTINFSKTIRQYETEKWWNRNVENKVSSFNGGNNGVAPQTLTSQQILTIIGVTKSSKSYFSNLEFYAGSNASGTPVTSFSTDAKSKKLVFTLAITTVGSTKLSKKFTINWAQTRNEKSVADWVSNLKEPKTITSHPKTKIDFNWFKTKIGWNSDPNIKNGTFVQPSVTVTGLNGNLSKNNKIDPNPIDKSWTFNLHYKSNGTSSGTSLTRHFVISFAQSQQDYLNGINIRQASHSESSDLLNSFTAVGETFGDIVSNIDASNTPLSEKALKAMNNPKAFTSSKKGVKINVKSAALKNITSGQNNKAQVEQTVQLEIHYQKAVRNISVVIRYKNADIKTFVNQSQMQTQLNSITAVGDTNSASINVPNSFFTYFDNQHLEVSVLLNGSNSQRIISGKTSYPIPSGLLQNNSSNNSLNITLQVQPKQNYQDPNGMIAKVANQVSKSLSWNIWIDTSSIQVFDQGGQSNALIAVSGPATSNWNLVDRNNQSSSHYQVEVRWVDMVNNNRNWVSIGSFKRSSQIPSNIWDQTVSSSPNGAFKGYVEARLVPDSGYVLSDQPNNRDTQNTNSKFFSSLKKVIWSGQISSTKLVPTNFFGNIQKYLQDQLVSDKNADTHRINWATVQNDLEAYALKNNIKISFSLKPNPSSSNSSDWINPANNRNVAILPTNFRTYKDDRHFFVKIDPINNNFQISGTNVIDMAVTAVPEIKKLKGWIDFANSIKSGSNKKQGNGQPSQATNTLSGKTNNLSVNIANLVLGLEYRYSSDGGKTWTNQSTFINNVKDISLKKSDFMWKVVVTSSDDYVLSTTSNSCKFDVFKLKTYIDIQSEINALGSSISFVGQFGKGQKVYIPQLNSPLTKSDLQTRRLKLQYKINKIDSINHSPQWTNWKDFPSNTISGSSIKGAKSWVQYIEIGSDLISGNDSPQIEFRIIPYLDDDGNDVSSQVNNLSSISDFEEKSTTSLSNHEPNHLQKDMILPTVVSSGTLTPGDFTFSSPSGTDTHSKNFTINIAKNEIAVLSAANTWVTSPNYWTNLHFVFSISDKSGIKKYWFLKGDFEKWLHGQYTSGALPTVWEVEDANGNKIHQVNMRKVPLPSQFRTPKWNELDTSSLKVRWATDTVSGSSKIYVASDDNAYSITNFTSQVYKWFDPSQILNAVKSVYIEGDTHSFGVDASKVVQNPIESDTSYIKDPYLSNHNLKSEYSKDGINWSTNLPTYNNDTEHQNRFLYMRVVPLGLAKSNNDFASSNPSQTSVFIDYPDPNKKYASFKTAYKNGNERYFKYYVDTSSLNLFKVPSNGYLEIAGNQTTKNWQFTDSNAPGKSHVKVLVKWVPKNGSNPSNPFVTISLLKNQLPKNIWNQAFSGTPNGGFKGHIVAKLVSNNSNEYVLSNPRTTSSTNAIFANLKKVINTGRVVSSSRLSATNFMGKIQQYLKNGLANVSNTLNINWGKTQSLLEAYANKNNIKISYSQKPSPSRGDWVQPVGSKRVAILPKTIDTYHGDRYFFIKIEAITGYKLEGKNDYDMAVSAVPKIKQLIGWIDSRKSKQGASQKQGNGVPTKASSILTGTTDNPSFTMGSLVTGLKYEYSVDGVSKWTDKTNFIKDMKDINLIKANFKWRLVVVDSAKYVLSSLLSGNFTVDDFKTYIDIQDEINTLKAGISFKGQFGVRQKVYIEDLDAKLFATQLSKKRVKLQYKINGVASIAPSTLANWTDLPQNTITGSGIAGSKSGGSYIEIASDLIPGNSSPQIIFRFVPYYDDNKQDISSSININSMNAFENASTAFLSQTFVPHDTQKIILPTIVSTGTIDPKDFTFKSDSLVAHSKDFQIDIAKSEIDKLTNANSISWDNPSYLSSLHFVFSISDGSGVKRYGFKKRDFETWLHGGFSSGALPLVWELCDGKGTKYSQIDMKQVVLPNQFKTPVWNNLDTSSLKVQWATDATKTIKGVANTAQIYFVASDANIYSLNNFETQVLKWYDPTKILNAVQSVYITGNTNSYSIDPTNVFGSKSSNTNYIDSSYLSRQNLERQFSIDSGKTWTTAKPKYITWQARNDRLLSMRVVPKYNYDPNNPFVSSKTTSKSLFLAYPRGVTKASFVTNNTNSFGERYFKVYVKADVSELSQVKISGTQFMLGTGTIAAEANGVNESIDNDIEDDSVIELEYKYNNAWYNKKALLNAIVKNRTPAPGQDLSFITFPSDFANGNVSVRWHLTGTTNNYYLSSQTSQAIYSTYSAANATLLKNFINVWKFQSEMTKTLSNNPTNHKYSIDYNEPRNNSLDTNGELLTPDYRLSGSLNEASLSLDGIILTPQFLANNNLKIQYTTDQYPSETISGSRGNWIDATGNQSGLEIFNKVIINNKHKSLWIRIIIDPNSSYANTTVVSSYKGGGNINIVRPIKIDATRMKFLITTSANALKQLDMGGTTQHPTVANLDNFFSGSDASITLVGPGQWGIWYQKQVIGRSRLKTITSPSDAKQWVAENGITIRWQVKQTRTSSQIGIPSLNGIVNGGATVEFDDFAQLLAAVRTGKLNFDRNSLKVQWGILPSQRKNNEVSDKKWIQPTNFAMITNIIFSRDFVTLTPTSVRTAGNTAATFINPKSSFIDAIPTGLQLEYSLDGATGWSTTKPAFTNPSSIGGNKKLYIRLQPIPFVSNTGGYTLKTPNKDDQITEVDNSNVYIAIPLASDNAGTKAASKAEWELYCDTVQVASVSSATRTGHTTFGSFAIWTGNTLARQIPTILNAEDNNKKGHWEYSIDDFKSKYLTLEDAMLDYYSSGIKSFDKDREDHFSMRYVLDPMEKILSNGNAGYVFTDVNGNEIPDASMSFEVDITKLIQYLYIDNTDLNLPADQAGNVSNMSWRQLANEPKFCPGFKPAASGKSRYVDYTQMEYKGQYVDSNGRSLYKFDVNPFTNVLDTFPRDSSNMLAPRHAHFEYSTKQTPASNWTNWSKRLPIDRPLESNNKFFRIRIAPDQGYEIPTRIFAAGDQNWSKEYVVVILKNTEQLTFKSIEYVGFNTATNGEGRIKTDDPNGDFTKGNPLFEIEKSGSLWSDYKDTSSSSAFVLEYNIYNNGIPIAWTDTTGLKAKGWHSNDLAPSQSKIWYGDMPVSLKNGDVIHIRLRAKNGFIIDDKFSKGKKADDTAPYSTEIVLPPVSGLIQQLNVPATFKVYDTKHNIDFSGNKIIKSNSNMPKLTFAGSETKGTVVITPGSLAGFSSHIKYEVQVLRPTFYFGASFDSNMKPRSSYQILDNQGNVLKKVGDVWQATTGAWKKDIDYIPNTWVDPSVINWLQVGDALRIRVVAKMGYGFRWEDPKSSYTDINLTPKKYDQFAHNKNGVLSNTNGNVQGTATPLPVTGLLVKPPKLPSEISLVYSPNPVDNIQGNVKNLKTSFSDDPSVDKWLIKFQFLSVQTGNWTRTPVTSIKSNLYNGDKIRIIIDVYQGYLFDPTYQAQNIAHEITIQGLKDMIDMTNTSHPKLSFSGYQGQGKIEAIVPSDPNKPFATTKDANGFAKPKIYSKVILNGVKWQYQVYESNPSSAAKSSIDLLPWLNTAPKNLKAGWYVRMRVAPKNVDDFVLTNLGTPGNPQWFKLYSEASYNDKNNPAHQKGWVEVVGLKLNPSNIGLKLKVSGFIEKTKVSHEFTIFDGQGLNKIATADEDAIFVEFQNDAFPNKWFNASNFNQTYPKLTNGDKISMRVVPRSTKQLMFDPEDPSIGHNGYKIDSTKGKTYLRNFGWDHIVIKGLKKYLDVSRVILDKPNSLLGLGNFEPMTPSQKDKVSGQVKLINAVLTGLRTISDVEGNTIDKKTGKPFSSYVQVEYKIERIHPDTGERLPATTSLHPPTKLRNGDKITVELVVTDDTYKLSKSIFAVIIVEGLQQILREAEWPKFVFNGASGSGTVSVSNNVPEQSGLIWEYVVQYQGKKVLDGNEMWTGHSYIAHADKTITEIEQYSNSKGNLKWREKSSGEPIDINRLKAGDTLNQVPIGSPRDLSNGDLIKARLVSFQTSLVSRIQDKDDPSKSTPIITQKWTTVSGLIEEIDLSGVRIKAWNSKKPYEPNNKDIGYKWIYPFKMSGHQEGSAAIVIDASIAKKPNFRQLLDTNGNPIPFADKLQWEFAADFKDKITDDTVWTKTIPQGLKSQQYIHARFAIRSGVENAKVKNFIPITFRIPKLEPAQKIDSNIFMFVGIGIGGVVVFGGILGFVFAMRTRRKLNYGMKPRM